MAQEQGAPPALTIEDLQEIATDPRLAEVIPLLTEQERRAISQLTEYAPQPSHAEGALPQQIWAVLVHMAVERAMRY